jgi:hypothetical protein
MVEAMGLKIRHRGPLQWHHLPTKSHENLPIGSTIDRGSTHRQNGDLISLIPFLGSRLMRRNFKLWCMKLAVGGRLILSWLL